MTKTPTAGVALSLPEVLPLVRYSFPMIHPIEGEKDTMRDLHLRRVAVFVYEPDPGDFYWVLIESKDDAYSWLDIEGAQAPHPTWIGAFEAGNTALLKLVADQNMGPLAPVEDENASSVG